MKQKARLQLHPPDPAKMVIGIICYIIGASALMVYANLIDPHNWGIIAHGIMLYFGLIAGAVAAVAVSCISLCPSTPIKHLTARRGIYDACNPR